MATQNLQPGAAPANADVHQPSRRGLIAAMIAAPAIAITGPLAAADSGTDQAILRAWERRQTALAGIEARGVYYWCEEHSPELAAAHSAAEMDIYNLPAFTPRGVLAKLWVAFEHVGTVHDANDHALYDMIRRADLLRLRLLRDDLDFDQAMILSAIEALTNIRTH